MANSNMGGSIGCYENEHFFYEVDPDVFSCDELIPNTTDPKQNPQQVFDLSAGTNELFSSLSTNGGEQTGSGGARLCLQQQCHQPLGTNELLQDILLTSTINQGRLASPGAQPWLQQQLGQPPGPEGYLQEPWINQGQGIQAAAATESLIAQQHSGQSSVPFTGDPCSQRNIVKISGLHSLVKKRRYDKTYREKVKKQKQDLVNENGRLKLEIEGKRQQMKSELEASEVENGRLKFKMEECEAENGRLKSKLEEFEAENGRLKSKLEAFEAENGKLKHEIQGKEEQMKSKLEASEAENGRLKSKLEEFEAENGRLKHEIQVKEQQMKFNLETEFKRLRDEVDSLKRGMNQRMQTQSTELVQLRNKFDKFELEQQNQRTKRKRSMSSIQEFGPQTTENDSVDSAKTFPTIRSAKMRRPASKRVESFSDQLKALAVAAQTSERGAQGEAVESQRLGRESRRLRSEALGNIDPTNVLKIRPNQTVELVGPIHESNNGQGRVVEVERLNSQVQGTIDPPDNNALIVNVLKTGPDLDG